MRNMIPYHNRSTKQTIHTPTAHMLTQGALPLLNSAAKAFSLQIAWIYSTINESYQVNEFVGGEWRNKTNSFSLSVASASPDKFTSEILLSCCLVANKKRKTKN